MVQPRNETEDLLLSITKNCETLNKQTHTKPHETLKIEINKPRETFHFNSTISTERCWMVGLTSQKVYNSIFNITEKNKSLKFFTDNFDESSFT